MSRIIALACAAALLAAVLGCARDPGGTDWSEYRTPAITILGAGTGAAIGSLFGGGTAGRTAGILLGAAAGGALGYWLSERMTQDDRQVVSQALDTGETVKWRNEQTGNQYTLVPLETASRDGRTCREFRLEADTPGQEETSYGTACQQPDGKWQIVSSKA